MSEQSESIQISARVSRGQLAGTELRPHRYRNGRYVVSKTRFKSDYIYVDTLESVARHIEQGYSVRMSGEGIGPSLISPRSISVSR